MTIEDEKVFLEDLGSQNGTFINDVKIESKSLLRDYDIFYLGPIVFEFTGLQISQKERNVSAREKEQIDTQIADWLGGDDDSDVAPPIGQETTIIKWDSDETGLKTKAIPSRNEGEHADPPSSTQHTPVKEHFDSVAEEAAVIIQRYKNSLKEKESQS